MNNLSEEERNLILHMTGSIDSRKMQGYRNYGAFSHGSDNLSIIESLAEKGFAKKYLTHNEMDFYHVTKKGCILSGMTKAGTKRAMNFY